MRFEKHKWGMTLLLLQSVCVGLVACTHLGAPKKSDVTTPARGISRPENPDELLSNLKVAFDDELVLAPEFFDDASLLKFFNGTSIQWETGVPPDIRPAVVAPGPLQVGAREITVRMWEHGPSVTDSEIRVALTPQSDLTLGRVRQIFGVETRTVFPEVPMHMSTGYMPPTPFGIEYEKRVYPAGIDGRPYRMTVDFSAEGNFHGMALHGPHADRLPDQAKVTVVSLKVMVE